MIIAIHQPQYLPWLGYFDKMDRADVFCYLDNVQFKKNEWQNRNRIKTAEEWQWITVPVKYHFPQKIQEVEINNDTNWRKKHIQALITNYAGAPFFKEYMPVFEAVYNIDWNSISKLNIHTIEICRKFLGIDNIPTILASDYADRLSNDPTDRLIDICKIVGADTYLSGAGGGNYMNLDRFTQTGINLIFQDFKHPVYPQRFGDFISNLSIVDLLFNCGDQSIEIIRQNRRLVL